MITTWLAITLAIIGVGHATCKKGAVLDSVSEIAYIIPHWAFSSWTALVGILLMPDIMEHLPENWQWIGLFVIVFIGLGMGKFVIYIIITCHFIFFHY